MNIRVYCAGKISKRDWRHRLFRDLSDVSLEEVEREDGSSTWIPYDIRYEQPRWVSFEDLIYAGPYFIEGDHGDAQHGVGAETAECGGHPKLCGKGEISREETVRLCLEWINAADAMFVWLTDPSAYGTIAEMGYAHGRGKPIYLYTPYRTYEPLNDLWWVTTMAECRYAADVQTAFRDFQNAARRDLAILRLKRMPYAEYLTTDHWKCKRGEALAAAEYRCQLCNDTDSLTVHHRTYERRGEELLSDLVTLCKSCHSTFHGARKLATSELPSATERKQRRGAR